MSNGLAERLKAWRSARSLSQGQVAEYLGVTRQAVYLWERFGRFAHEEMLRKALLHYDCEHKKESL